jgi:hypothetical protein
MEKGKAMNDKPKNRPLISFEHRHQPLITQSHFIRRMIWTVIASLIGLTAWVIVGMLGYHILAELPWVDSFLNAAMIVGGMGPVDMLHAESAKVFAGLYAILSGVIFLSIFGFLIAPVFHRFLHRFHLDGDDATKR